MASLAELPGEPLVTKGLADLEAGLESIESLLVSIGAPRLAGLGLDIPRPLQSPEHRLYELLSREDPDGAHSRYNALVRRLVSFERERGSSLRHIAGMVTTIGRHSQMGEFAGGLSPRSERLLGVELEHAVRRAELLELREVRLRREGLGA